MLIKRDVLVLEEVGEEEKRGCRTIFFFGALKERKLTVPQVTP